MLAKGIYRVPTLILEAFASYDLWIWHAFFGCPGSFNDLNILHWSNVFQKVYEDRAPKCKFIVNGRKYNIWYFLSDLIHPKWATFLNTIPLSQGPKARLFVERQESVRKDVERAFGVLQVRFAIIRGPAWNMDKAELYMIMKACVILHNMIVEDERDSYDLTFDYDDVEDNTPQPNVQRDHHPCYVAYLHRVAEIHDPALHDVSNQTLSRKYGIDIGRDKAHNHRY